MANRSMQAKTLKLRRQRRAWAKPYSRIKGLQPNLTMLQQAKNAAKGLAISDEDAEILYQAIFHRASAKGIPPGRYEVLKLLANANADITEFNFKLIENAHQSAYVHWSGDKSKWMIVHCNKRTRVFRRSIVYPSKVIAVTSWNTSSVRWVEVISSPQ